MIVLVKRLAYGIDQFQHLIRNRVVDREDDRDGVSRNASSLGRLSDRDSLARSDQRENCCALLGEIGRQFRDV